MPDPNQQGPEPQRLPASVGIELATKMIEQLVVLNANLAAVAERLEASIERLDATSELINRLGATVAALDETTDSHAFEVAVLVRALCILDEQNAEMNRLGLHDLAHAVSIARDELESDNDNDNDDDKD